MSLSSFLGLAEDSSRAAPGIPNLAPYYIIYHFVFGFIVLSSRPAKNYFKIDHNSNPRHDVTVYGARAVQAGKMTQSQLKFIQRNEACHANSMEHFPMFVGAALFATVAGVDSWTVNAGCLMYTVARMVYAAAYLAIERGNAAYVRSLSWWASNGACFWLLGKAGSALNGDK